MEYRAWSSMCQQNADMQLPTYSQGTITPVISSSPITYRRTEPYKRLLSAHNSNELQVLNSGAIAPYTEFPLKSIKSPYKKPLYLPAYSWLLTPAVVVWIWHSPCSGAGC